MKYKASKTNNYLSCLPQDATIRDLFYTLLFNGRFMAVCKSRNGESGNGMKGMMGMRVIRVGMRGIGVGMRGIGLGMRGIRVGMMGIMVGMMGIRVGM